MTISVFSFIPKLNSIISVMNIVYWMITKFVIFGVWKLLSISKQITFECVHFYSIICPLRHTLDSIYNQILRYTKVPKGSKNNNIKEHVGDRKWYLGTRLYSIGKHEKKKCTSYNNKTYFEFKLTIYNLIRNIRPPKIWIKNQ